MEIDLIDLGCIDYISAYILQLKTLEEIRERKKKNTLIFCEHTHTITLGRKTNPKNILISKAELENLKIKVYSTDRGGDVTYHGPGQLVIYPILDLALLEKDIRKFLRRLEILIILTLRDFNIESEIKEDFRGVWIKDKKIASIGIGLKNWISYHGLSLNVNTQLFYFDLIKPCGLNVKMTSMEEILREKQDIEKVKERIFKNFKMLFQTNEGGNLYDKSYFTRIR